jgi:flagellin-like hook-associated protein FlgL
MDYFLVPTTHWDREWYRTFQGFRSRLVDLTDRVLELASSDAGYRFMFDGQTIVLEDYLEVRPERRQDLVDAIGRGQISVGPWYVQPDSLLPSGEAHVRNLFEGRRVAESFGPCSTSAYTPDSFGHPAQFPQLLRGFGLGAFLFWRGCGNERDYLPSEFKWVAPDGTSIRACWLACGYFNAANLPTDIDAAAAQVAGTWSVTVNTPQGSQSMTMTLTQDGTALLGNADDADTGLSLLSVDYGSDAFVSVKSLSGGPFPVTDPEGNVADRNAGTDIDARVNGIRAIGRGLQATVSTSTLDLTFSVLSTVEDGDSTAFRIVGGGAQFQLGPEVVSNQQARLGIASVNTARLGGASGRLFELRSGGTKSLSADTAQAARVVDEATNQMTSLRGRLGAFQRTTLETNTNALNDTLESLTEAESSIRDADFATETARLTRAQILVQSGISVLSIANSSPQNVLALLRNQ